MRAGGITYHLKLWFIREESIHLCKTTTTSRSSLFQRNKGLNLNNTRRFEKYFLIPSTRFDGNGHYRDKDLIVSYLEVLLPLGLDLVGALSAFHL